MASVHERMLAAMGRSRSNIETVDLVQRYCRAASSWVRRATAHATSAQRSLPGAVFPLVEWEVGKLAVRLADSLEELVPLLGPDEAGDVERQVREVARMLRARRLAGLMDDTTGRTPEEAATYRAAAERLRAS